jgi:hypothetical protein
MTYKELFQTYLTSSISKENDQLEYLVNTYVEELEGYTENEACFNEEWIDSFDYFCREAAGLTNLTEDQFIGLGQIISKCNRDDLVYVLWPEEKELSVCLNFASDSEKTLKEFGLPIFYNRGNAYIKIPFSKLSNYVLVY